MKIKILANFFPFFRDWDRKGWVVRDIRSVQKLFYKDQEMLIFQEPFKSRDNCAKFLHFWECVADFKKHFQKMKFLIKDFFRKCDQIHRKLQIWSHILKISLMENFIFRAAALEKTKEKTAQCKFIKGKLNTWMLSWCRLIQQRLIAVWCSSLTRKCAKYYTQ